MIKLDHVKPLPGIHADTCGVCGCFANLTHGCVLTRIKVGQCCVVELTFVDRMLGVFSRKTGIIHPQPDTYGQS